MLLLNKLISYDQGIISKFPVVLKELKNGPVSVHDLYNRMIKKMSGISEFIDTLDCLYELGKIEFDEEEEVLRYADKFAKKVNGQLVPRGRIQLRE